MAECVGFVSATALTWQTYRLVTHQRTVRDLRHIGERNDGTRTGALAKVGAEALEETIGRWDARDQWFVVIGLVGLTLSFLLKLVALAMT